MRALYTMCRFVGLVCSNVWNSKEEFEAFAHDQIGPITAEVGIEGAPEVTFYEVHNYLTAG
jgi:hypothetical protein